MGEDGVSGAMKEPRARRPLLLFLLLPGLAAFLALDVYDQRPVLADEPAPAAAVSSARRPFAVVELFTSEGCSSCPPAEALLNEISGHARRQGRNVICLAWHVDYWDRLGWKDPYGSSRNTVRQRLYNRALGRDGIYTPQAVVNGRAEFVGHSRRKARSAIQEALKRPAELGLSLEAAPGQPWGVRYRLDADPPRGARVLLALSERGLLTQVERGENSGRRLRHEEVVRAVQQERLSGREGTLAVTPPAGVERGRASLVVLVQAGRGKPVLAAGRLDLR